MGSREFLVAQLPHAFLPEDWVGVAAPHGCEECAAMSDYLRGKSWPEVSGEFVDEYDGSLPLLSADAYLAFLPAWLYWCVVNPERQAVGGLLVNLECYELVTNFNNAQAFLVREAAKYIIENNGWGPEDEGNIRALAQIRSLWSRSEA